MRPPLNAGENSQHAGPGNTSHAASMRPPLNAGENRLVAQLHAAARPCFNEAPAERGGKPLDGEPPTIEAAALQ